MLEALLPYLLGFAGKLALDFLQVKIPGIPTPAADPEATSFLTWLLKVKSGIIRLDDKDKEVLRLIVAAMPAEQAPVSVSVPLVPAAR